MRCIRPAYIQRPEPDGVVCPQREALASACQGFVCAQREALASAS